jgi:hypothetical protein
MEQLPEQQSRFAAQTAPLAEQLTQVMVMGPQTFEQQSVSLAQAPALAIQQVPLLHVWPVEQPLPQFPPQPSGPHVLPVQLGVQHELLTQVWPELQSVFTRQATQVDVAVSQTSEQQSVLLAQPASPVGIQLTQVLVVESQMWEQQSVSLAQAPALAIQQAPLLQVWAAEHVETQVPPVESHFRHWLVAHGADRQWEPQTFALSQHPLLRQV